MKNSSKSVVALLGLVAGLGLLGSAFVTPAAALTISSEAPRVASGTAVNVIDLPAMVITGDAHHSVKSVRHSSKPAVKVSRTFVHALAQGGSPDAPSVIVHDYQDAE